MGNDSKGRADHIDHLVSKKLRMRRMMLGLSQQDLGQAVDVSIQQVQKYEKATNRISSGKLHAFSKVLKVPISYFFDQIDEQNNSFGHIFAEEAEPYDAVDKDAVTEREIITLVRAFCEVKSPQSRKKVVELVKTMS